MKEEYLWDRSGEPDQEIVELERLLSRFRFSNAGLPEVRSSRAKRSPAILYFAMAMAAAVILTIGIAMIWGARLSSPAGPRSSWRLSISGGKPSALRTGQTIETDSATHAIVVSDQVGELRLAPQSRLRLLAASQGGHRFALDHGTIHALIWARPTHFVVDTPSAKTVDLGCQYTLHVGRDGSGMLTVETGWVAFEWNHLESFIPAEATCRTRPGLGPGTPYFLDAPKAMTEPLARYELSRSEADLARILAAARKRDALTIWHLLTRTQGRQRAEVFDHFARLVKLPPEATRQAIVAAGDPKALDAAWNALELGDMTWWREWKRPW